ncbi:N-acetylglucosaminyldiphosphoundecaprenol+N-acetyl-beta-D-mannosaminyltransferase [Methylocapsa aurea]
MNQNCEKLSTAEWHFRRNVYCLLGLPIDALRLNDVIELVRSANRTGSRLVLLTPNTNDIIQSLSSEHVRNAFLTSDISIADGMPLVWLSRFLRLPIRERLAGADVFDGLRHGTAGTMTVFFFGGAEGVAEIASQNINCAHGGLRCIGAVSPGFGTLEDLSNASYIDQINQASPDLLVLSLGKHGKPWIVENARKIHRGVVSHLGAVVNFAADRIRRAPRPFQALGLEWMWRILQEPVLFHRYYRDATTLLRLIYACVLPLRIEQIRYSARPSEHKTQQLRILTREGGFTIQLLGAWTASDLTPLRDALIEACDRQADITFDLSAVTYLDSAVVGTIASAYGWQQRSDRRFEIAVASDAAKRLLRLHCCSYLLE